MQPVPQLQNDIHQEPAANIPARVSPKPEQLHPPSATAHAGSQPKRFFLIYIK